MKVQRLLILGGNAGGISGAVLRRSARSRICLEALFPPAGPGGSDRGVAGISDPAAVAGRIKRSNGWLRGAERCLVVSDLQCFSAHVQTPIVDPSRQPAVVRHAAVHMIPCSFDDLIWDYHVLSNDGIELGSVVFAANHSELSDIWNACTQRGFRPGTAGVSLPLYYNAYRYNYPDATSPALLIVVESRATQLLWIGRKSFHIRTLPAGCCALGQAPRASIERIGKETERSVAANRRTHPDLVPETVLLGASEPIFGDLNRELSARLQLKVDPFDPLRRVDCSPGLDPARCADIGPILGAMVGQAAIPLIEAPVKIDLAPADLMARARNRRSARLGLAAAGLFAIAPLFPITHLRDANAHVEALAREARVRTAPLAAIQDDLARLFHEIEELAAETSEVERLAGARGDWIRFLADLQHHLNTVEDVWLDRLELVSAPSTSDRRIRVRAAGPSAPGNPQVSVEGRMIDRENPLERASITTQRRVNQLLARIEHSPFVAQVHHRRFDTDSNGILRFAFVLELNQEELR